MTRLRRSQNTKSFHLYCNTIRNAESERSDSVWSIIPISGIYRNEFDCLTWPSLQAGASIRALQDWRWGKSYRGKMNLFILSLWVFSLTMWSNHRRNVFALLCDLCGLEWAQRTGEMQKPHSNHAFRDWWPNTGWSRPCNCPFSSVFASIRLPAPLNSAGLFNRGVGLLALWNAQPIPLGWLILLPLF